MPFYKSALIPKFTLLLLFLLAWLTTCGPDPLQSEDEGQDDVAVYLPTVIADSTAVWHPTPGTTWQWQLTGDIDTSFDVDMYDIDLFDVPQSVIDELHGDGRIVI